MARASGLAGDRAVDCYAVVEVGAGRWELGRFCDSEKGLRFSVCRICVIKQMRMKTPLTGGRAVPEVHQRCGAGYQRPRVERAVRVVSAGALTLFEDNLF